MDIDEIMAQSAAAIEAAHIADTFGVHTGLGLLATFLMDLKANGYEVVKTVVPPATIDIRYGMRELADVNKTILVMPGVPYETKNMTDADDKMVEWIEKGWSHSTWVLVDKDWHENSMTAENRGVLITNIKRLSMPVYGPEDD